MKLGAPAAGVHPRGPAPPDTSIAAGIAHRFADFVALTKPRLNLLVLVTTLAGLYLASPAGVELSLLVNTLVGTALVAGGAAALNQVWERRTDALMRRTSRRPLPGRRLGTILIELEALEAEELVSALENHVRDILLAVFTWSHGEYELVMNQPGPEDVATLNLPWENLILDGIGDFINGLFGATAGTNYGENNSLMAITRNYSGPALMMAGVISILLAFIGKLSALVNSVPLAVSGGLAIYLFGVIGMQGIALMQEHRVSMFNPRNLAVGAVIMVIGIGGNIGYAGGFLPIQFLQGIFPSGLPAIATAAVLGILLNAIFLIFKPEGEAESRAESAMASAD